LKTLRFVLAQATRIDVMLFQTTGTPETKMSLALQLKDYRLTTAEILYHMPDHPGILQSFIWQDLDLAPRFPVLHKFLDFWDRELDARVHSVRVASASVVKPASFRSPGITLRVH
jgi:uncharacterized protein Usg